MSKKSQGYWEHETGDKRKENVDQALSLTRSKNRFRKCASKQESEQFLHWSMYKMGATYHWHNCYNSWLLLKLNLYLPLLSIPSHSNTTMHQLNTYFRFKLNGSSISIISSNSSCVTIKTIYWLHIFSASRYLCLLWILKAILLFLFSLSIAL